MYRFGRFVLQIIRRTVGVVDENSVASVARARRRRFLGICERVKVLDRARDLARGATSNTS